jgi:NADH/NAD ratio-sensing transcriptional regulator Rex
LKNLDEIDKLLDTYDHPKLNLEDISHLNRSISSNEIEVAIVSLPKKSLGNDRFSAEFCQTLNEELIPALLKFFHEIEREETMPNTLHVVSITLIPKWTSTHPKRWT